MVAASQPLAAAAAKDVLTRGGNAADAAIAAAFVLAVTEPTMSGIGGRAQILVRTTDGEFAAINGMTEVPASYVRPPNPPADGYGAIATPGVVAALERLHREHASLPRAALLAYAIGHARDGFALPHGEAQRQARVLAGTTRDAEIGRVFLAADGKPRPPGATLRQPMLAATLEEIARAGADAFYRGRIANAIADDMAANGGFVTRADLAGYRALDGRIVKGSYRGHRVHTIAAPAGGGLLVKALHILENFDLAAMPEWQWAAVASQAVALALHSMTDDYQEADLAALASKRWARAQAAHIVVPQRRRSAESSPPLANTSGTGAESWTAFAPSAPRHTAHLSIADCEGMLVSMTQTLGPAFGAKVVTPGLGFVYAATMGSYLASAVQTPGSRPRTAIAPTVVTRNGETVLVLGAAGGTRILSALVQTISRAIDRGQSIVSAVGAPRLHPLRETAPGGGPELRMFQAERAARSGWRRQDLRAWRQAGFKAMPVRRKAAFGRVFAVAQNVAEEERWLGVADPDWEGAAVGPDTSRCAVRHRASP